MRAPFASYALGFHALNTVLVGALGLYRGELYSFPSSAWALAGAVGALGLGAPLVLPARLRVRLLTGRWPLVMTLPFLAFLAGPRLVPSPLTVGPFFFCAGASFATCLLVVWNVARRKRALRSLLGPSADDPRIRSHLEAYFTELGALAEETARKTKPLLIALQAQAWLPGEKQRAHAAALLRDYAAYIERSREITSRASLAPDVLYAQIEASRASLERMRVAFLGAAGWLESGGRIVRWNKWLRSLSSGALDADRDLLYAGDYLARRHGVSRPDWFRTSVRRLGRAPLTASDVAPPWNALARFGKPAAVLLAAVVAANAVLALAAAKAPASSAHARTAPAPHLRPLPVITGLSGESHIDPRLSEAVTRLARRRAEVRCWSSHEWEAFTAEWAPRDKDAGEWAFASTKPGIVHLGPKVCTSLGVLAYGDAPLADELWKAYVVATLAHETQHVLGVSNEATAECYGMQSIRAVTQALGRTADEGRLLASLFWRSGYRNQDPAYISPECRNGGRLDLRPTSNIWP